MNKSTLVGFSNYEISSDGSIFDLKRSKFMAQTPNSEGYLKVTLRNDLGVRKTFSVHRLLAQLFIANPENLKEVNHLDGVKSNNSLSNLEWVNHSQNLQHAWDMGLLKSTEERSRKLSEALKGKNMGSLNPRARKVVCVTTGVTFDTIKEACETYGVQQASLSRCCSPKYPTKTAGKHPETGVPLEWKYYEN